MNDPIRFTARGIIRRNENILLMERWNAGEHYFSIPGGLIESNESPEETVVREVLEETTVHIRVTRQILELRGLYSRHYIFLCEYERGEPHLPSNAEEAQSTRPDNRFKPQWITIDALSQIPFGFWEPLKQPVISGLNAGFESSVKVVTVSNAR